MYDKYVFVSMGRMVGVSLLVFSTVFLSHSLISYVRAVFKKSIDKTIIEIFLVT